MSLYRKYRPKNFSEIIDQQHVVKTLMGAIESDQVGHAYIFAGTRGTGKTSIARIFAKSVNCMSRNRSEPCEKCQVCIEMNNGSFLDLIEIDAASNRGIDEIRDLKEKIRFAPNLGKYKVYIIDEAHMLTEPAFNALLKTLEEPPSHVIFILATTEIHKIPITILSRCQRFDFHKVDSGKMFEGVKRIVSLENIKINDDDLRKIISISEGSIRDALSYLDQLNSFSAGVIDSEILENILGYSKEEMLIEFLELILGGDLKAIVSFVNKVVAEGKELESYLKNLIVFLRKIMMARIDPANHPEFADPDRVMKLANGISFEKLVSLIDILSGVVKNSRFSFMPQLVLELELIRFISKNEPDKNIRKNEASNIAGKIVSEIKNVLKPESKSDTEEGRTTKEISNENPFDDWTAFLGKLKSEKMVLYMALQGCGHGEKDGAYAIEIYNGFYYSRLNERQNLGFINSVFKEFFGEKRLVISRAEKANTPKDVVTEALRVFGGEVLE